MHTLVLAVRFTDWYLDNDTPREGPIAVMVRFISVAFFLFMAVIFHGLWLNGGKINSLFNRIEDVTTKMRQYGCQLSSPEAKVRNG
jgi:hypothetical protein